MMGSPCRYTVWALALLTITFAQESQAYEEDVPERAASHDVWQRRRFALEADMGVALPVGALGVMFDYAPWSELSVACGVGTNFVGLQLACMLRPRVILAKDKAVTLGVGASTGPHEQSEGWAGLLGWSSDFGMGESASDDTIPTKYRWTRANWLNLELGFELRRKGGFVLRPVLGVASLMNPSSGEQVVAINAERRGRDPGVRSFLIYSGAGIGYAW